MCDFCHRHGEGQKWYLNAANYSEELFRSAYKRSLTTLLGTLADPKWPALEQSAPMRLGMRYTPRLVRWIARRYQQDIHWGQVVPLEDTLQVVDMLDWVLRLPCVCRSHTIGDRNARYCFAIGVAPIEEGMRSMFRDMIDPSLSMEKLTREEARAALIELDRRGAMHSIWTFKSPFIGGICNCDRDCRAYRAQIQTRLQVMFRAEYVARIDPDVCSGCRLCMRQCLFGAINYSLVQGRCVVNEAACYGCGVCRAACQHQAISLLPRASVPSAASIWGI